MATCLNCGKSFEPRKGSVGKYCSILCAKRHMRGKKSRPHKFGPTLGLRPRVPLAELKTGSWERENL